jgi:hypothetical protein
VVSSLAAHGGEIGQAIQVVLPADTILAVAFSQERVLALGERTGSLRHSSIMRAFETDRNIVGHRLTGCHSRQLRHHGHIAATVVRSVVGEIHHALHVDVCGSSSSSASLAFTSGVSADRSPT